MSVVRSTMTLCGITHEIDAFSIGDDAPIALEEAERALADDETARAERFMFAPHRHRFLRGRAYLRSRLAEVLGGSPGDISLTFGANGKPGLRGTNLAFNMSHSGDRAVLVIAERGHVGIDLECLDRSGSFWDDLPGLARICMTPREQTLLASLPFEVKRRRFLEFWTAKEARMKLTGEGLALDPASIALRLDRDRPAGFESPAVPGAETCFPVLPWDDAVCCLVSAPRIGTVVPDEQRGLA